MGLFLLLLVPKTDARLSTTKIGAWSRRGLPQAYLSRMAFQVMVFVNRDDERPPCHAALSGWVVIVGMIRCLMTKVKMCIKKIRFL